MQSFTNLAFKLKPRPRNVKFLGVFSHVLSRCTKCLSYVLWIITHKTYLEHYACLMKMPLYRYVTITQKFNAIFNLISMTRTWPQNLTMVTKIGTKVQTSLKFIITQSLKTINKHLQEELNRNVLLIPATYLKITCQFPALNTAKSCQEKHLCMIMSISRTKFETD